eukprot:NODE_2936_length_843_cov_59.442065_g2433_i0.p1 GENE.NODE_2936_length_843_cov_59.442065_g2433_i0~~NODE_2936_length_843_cov_59.442065_g2433_i0.p1  ORF type:complete len:271 (+),score=69.13 NODE_2936_length_843_cov_59.442065_g2433_i0:33-815(+)
MGNHEITRLLAAQHAVIPVHPTPFLASLLLSLPVALLWAAARAAAVVGSLELAHVGNPGPAITLGLGILSADLFAYRAVRRHAPSPPMMPSPLWRLLPILPIYELLATCSLVMHHLPTQYNARLCANLCRCHRNTLYLSGFTQGLVSSFVLCVALVFIDVSPTAGRVLLLCLAVTLPSLLVSLFAPMAARLVGKRRASRADANPLGVERMLVRGSANGPGSTGPGLELDPLEDISDAVDIASDDPLWTTSPPTKALPGSP